MDISKLIERQFALTEQIKKKTDELEAVNKLIREHIFSIEPDQGELSLMKAQETAIAIIKSEQGKGATKRDIKKRSRSFASLDENQSDEILENMIDEKVIELREVARHGAVGRKRFAYFYIGGN